MHPDEVWQLEYSQLCFIVKCCQYVSLFKCRSIPHHHVYYICDWFLSLYPTLYRESNKIVWLSLKRCLHQLKTTDPYLKLLLAQTVSKRLAHQLPTTHIKLLYRFLCAENLYQEGSNETNNNNKNCHDYLLTPSLIHPFASIFLLTN